MDINEQNLENKLDDVPEIVPEPRRNRNDKPAEFVKLPKLISRFVQFGVYHIERLHHDEMELPVFPDMKKAEEDYNSPDYILIFFNLRNGIIETDIPV